MTSQNETPPREWAPRIWEGLHFPGWLRLLCRNGFAVGPRQGYIAAIVTVISMGHTLCRLLQEALYGDRPGRTLIRHAPVFIVGHWRTGTTLLHELLVADPRHAFPTTYQCLEPNHFLLTEGLVTRWLSFLMPSRRPVDNMAAGWDKPQEDEFALCMMGQPSPYNTIAFPNHPPQDQNAFDPRQLPPRDRRLWKEHFVRFLRELTYKDDRRLILKSPTHSFRIEVLRELFPDARFVHIVRDPYTVFPSTVNLWRTLYETHGFQTPTGRGLEEYVFSTFERLYTRLWEGQQQVPVGRWHEMKFEDLVADPITKMEQLYAALELGPFAPALPGLEKYVEAQKGYRPNRYQALDRTLEAEITRRWGAVIRHYGYALR